MSLSDEVRDPWSYVVAGLAAGFAWALGDVVTGLWVGSAVYGTKVAMGALYSRAAGGRSKSKRNQERRLPVLTRTQEAAWLARAERAQDSFNDIARSARAGPISDEVLSFGAETAQSLASLQRLAGQASAIRIAMGRLDPKRLVWERDRLLAASVPGEDPRMLAERERSLNAVQSQLDAYGRLDRTLAMLLARLESGTLALEGLVARLAEVVALAETATSTSDGMTQLDELAGELEGLRAGLVEAEAISTQAMQGLAPLPSPGPGTVPTGQQQQNPSPVRRRAGGE
ncbi:MAG TPA: hypothetical protein VNA20_08220 [Frankiaceae bacterium]|nr:hypothetical protein [Frankiaceae bacterium]